MGAVGLVGAYFWLILAPQAAGAPPQGQALGAYRGPPVAAPVEPAPAPVRFATYGTDLTREAEGALIADLSTPFDPDAMAVARVLQVTRPEVVLLSGFDQDPAGEAVRLFRENYLEVSQAGEAPITYNHVFLGPTSAGEPSGYDLDNDGVIGGMTAGAEPGTEAYARDALGHGLFPGQGSMVLLSQHPIRHVRARTFSGLLWSEQPGALLPDDALTPEPDDWYSSDELAVLPLASTGLWDVPVVVDGRPVHVLCAGPTPPGGDGSEDRNGRRNHDELRFWADYVTPGGAGYARDDAGTVGGLGPGRRFVVLGDFGLDPEDADGSGDGLPGAVRQLLDHPRIRAVHPASRGGLEAAFDLGGGNLVQAGYPALDTCEAFGVGLRLDYLLPSVQLHASDAGVFWPADDEPYRELVEPGGAAAASSHRLVWADLRWTSPAPAPKLAEIELAFLGEARVPTGTQFGGTEVGGLSALVYDPRIDLYLALSDDVGTVDDPRLYTLTLDLADGWLSSGDVAFRDVVTLLDAGAPFAPGSLDGEGLALTEDGRFYLCAEGDEDTGLDPMVARFGVAGALIDPLAVPSKFLVGTTGFGPRDNKAFEGLALDPDQGTLFAAIENALYQDGPAASLSEGSPCRVLTYDLASGAPGAEYVSSADPVLKPPIPAGAFTTAGLVELLALSDTSLLVLERSFSLGVGNCARLYEVDLAGADDVSDVEVLAGTLPSVATAQKRLVLDLEDLGIPLDNLEGMALGPRVGGRPTLILVSDNNFSSPYTQFLAFAIGD